MRLQTQTYSSGPGLKRLLRVDVRCKRKRKYAFINVERIHKPNLTIRKQSRRAGLFVGYLLFTVRLQYRFESYYLLFVWNIFRHFRSLQIHASNLAPLILGLKCRSNLYTEWSRGIVLGVRCQA